MRSVHSTARRRAVGGEKANLEKASARKAAYRARQSRRRGQKSLRLAAYQGLSKGLLRLRAREATFLQTPEGLRGSLLAELSTGRGAHVARIARPMIGRRGQVRGPRALPPIRHLHTSVNSQAALTRPSNFNHPQRAPPGSSRGGARYSGPVRPGPPQRAGLLFAEGAHRGGFLGILSSMNGVPHVAEGPGGRGTRLTTDLTNDWLKLRVSSAPAGLSCGIPRGSFRGHRPRCAVMT